ncbi:carbohydrate ABC transporter substrate-binding protein [Cohnella endophytica]|uniref:Carbohydrate ABC transporter substrate-binding protein n=1 Tax=Cohnella endophytica TaxID=2419778 RepID=A0A494XUW7_9BACL|nr:ABC transporter substrate-binding protein [Cohnella endophytica]RKP54411.1 carbohydrate ABC transporter substrate-binding protein [Cohnella endophytica]
MKQACLTAMSVLFLLMVAGCLGSSDSTAIKQSERTMMDASRDKVNLSVAMYVTVLSVQDVYYDIVAEFEKKYPNIEVKMRFPGFEYEKFMSSRMEDHQLPDIFDTHGWSKIRYGQIVVDLSSEAWVHRLTETIRDTVMDTSGKVYAMPISEARDGITYNKGVLKKYGIAVPTTYDELIAAAEKLKADSNGEVVPFFFAATDDWSVGQFFDYFANALLMESGKAIDWSKWTQISEMFQQLIDRKLINDDVMTAKYSDIIRLFAEGKVAFAFAAPSFADEVFKYKNGTTIGIMPIPPLVAGNPPSFSGGERNTMAVWKDSPHIKEAKMLLSFFARSENLEKIEEVTKLPSGLKGTIPKHEFKADYEKYANGGILPYYDRTYLPYGMWDVICKNGVEQLAGRIVPEQFSIIMQTSAEQLMDK